MVHVHDQKAREIIVDMVRDEGYSQKKAARIANVARSTVRKYVSTFEETGSYFREDENRTGRNDLGTRASDEVVREIEAIIQRSGTLYLDEIAEEVYSQTGKRLSVTTLWRIIKRANFTRQKGRKWAVRRDDTLVNSFRKCLEPFFIDQLIFWDETGKSERDLRREFALSPKGKRPIIRHEAATGPDGKRYNALAALTSEGVLPPFVYEGSVNAEILLMALRRVVVPHLRPFHIGNKNCILIMDNAPIHHDERVRELIESTGAYLLYLPTYAPDLNPIEWVFAALKARLTRHWKPGCGTSLQQAIFDTLRGITPAEAKGFMRDAGYTRIRDSQAEAEAAEEEGDPLLAFFCVLRGLSVGAGTDK